MIQERFSDTALAIYSVAAAARAATGAAVAAAAAEAAAATDKYVSSIKTLLPFSLLFDKLVADSRDEF